MTWLECEPGTRCLQSCAPGTILTLSAGTSRLITSSKPFHRAGCLPPCASDSAFANIVCCYQFHLLTYSLIISSSIITVCTVVQNCCKGRSKRYKKWDFWGCSLSETLQRIDIKFGRDDYVGDGSEYPKWHINRFCGVISAKG